MIWSVFLLATGLFATLTAGEATAQSYVRLSPSSDLHCVYLPNGKTLIARQTDNGYRTTSFKSATKFTAKNLSSARKDIQKANGLIKKIQKQASENIFPIKLNPKEVKAVSKFYIDGELSGDIPQSPLENIAKIEAVKNDLTLEIFYQTELIKLIKKCKKKEVPSPGTLSTIFVNIRVSPSNAEKDSSGSGLTAVLAIVPPFIALKSPYLCYDHPRQGTRYRGASSNPCFINGLFYQDKDPATCNSLISRDAKGNPNYYFAFLEEYGFTYKDHRPGQNFADRAKGAEAVLRTNPIYGWGSSVAYATVGNVDACQQSIF